MKDFARNGSVLGFDAMWQLPARTEKHAYDLYLKTANHNPRVLYFGFPWASLIDGVKRGADIGTILRGKLDALEPVEGFDRVVTVCQHIKFREFIPEFKRAGITDLFASHAFRAERAIDGINIHPFPLFPVQMPSHSVWDQEDSELLARFLARSYRFSFIGAHDSRYYLTHSRAWIVDLAGAPGSLILSRDQWHYENRVYLEQVRGESLAEAELQAEQQNAREFRRVMAETRFALCPSGTGPNSIRLWEAIEFGCIPVILADDLRLPGERRLWKAACVIVNEREEAITDLPRLLKSLENDPDLIVRKLQALEKLKERYGRDNFITDLMVFSEAVAGADTVLAPGQRGTTHRVYLSNDGLDDSSLLSWICLLHFICDLLDLRLAIYLDATELPTWMGRLPQDGRIEVRAAGDAFRFLHDWRNEDLAVIGDSAALSRPLLERFEALWVKAESAPCRINTSLFDAVERAGQSDNIIKRQYDRIASDLGTGQPLASSEEWRPICTLITSMFHGDEYLEGFLDNSAALEQYERIEHLIARPNSPGREHTRLVEFVTHHPGAVYLWLKEDPGLYEVWNALCRLGTAPYLSNFNIDDRRAPQQVRTLVSKLDERLDVDVASAALRVSLTRNQPWSDRAAGPLWYAGPGIDRYSADSLLTRQNEQVVSHNMAHCMPVWRKSLHITNGFFDEARFGPSADWEFWLRTGKDKVGFHLHGEPLGLYLKTTDSYWRRSESSSENDRLIVSTYSDASGSYKPLNDDRPFALRVAEVMDAREKNQFTRYLWALRELHAAGRVQFDSLPALQRLVADLLERDFAIADPDILARRTCTQDIESVPARIQPLTWVLVEAIHVAGKERLAARPGALRNIRRVAEELALCGPSCELDLLKACLCRFEDDVAGEAYFLRKAHGRDSERFWTSLQAVYRFSVPLENICAQIGSLPPFYRFEDLAAGQTVYFLPDYTHGNPYQRLLYSGLAQKGVNLKGIGTLADLEKGGFEPKRGDVLHIHWINYLYKGVEEVDFPRVIDEFLDAVNALKQRGMRVFWTVHNRYSHDLPDIEVERSFRRRLCGLADRILVHHPCLLPQLADWLPHDAPVNFVEHGNYIGEYENGMSRDEARASLELEPDDVVISIIGQIRPYKSLHRYLPAFAMAMRENARLKLVIAGKVSCERTMEAIEMLPPDQVILKNEFIADSEFQRYLNAASYVFLCYRDILTSGSLFQAFSFGVAVIAPRLGSIPAYVVPGWNGHLFDDTNKVAAILFSLLDKSARSASGREPRDFRTARSLSW